MASIQMGSSVGSAGVPGFGHSDKLSGTSVSYPVFLAGVRCIFARPTQLLVKIILIKLKERFPDIMIGYTSEAGTLGANNSSHRFLHIPSPEIGEPIYREPIP